MPINTTMDRPACLHVGPLAEGSAETIAWAQVDGADKYELDASFNECFTSADTGKTWGNIHDLGKSWSDAALSWQDFENLPARGSAWFGIQSRNQSWTDIESEGLNWGEFHSQPPRHTVYMGPGTAFDLPDRTGGIWDNLNARSLEWSEVHQALPSWQDLTQLGNDNADHRSYTMQIPLGKKTASFRVRALASDGSRGDHITSAQIPITPLFHRESGLSMNVVRGNEYILQLHTRDIDRLSDVVFTLDYSPFFLQLSKSLPHISHGIQLGNTRHTPLQRLFARDGRVQFRWCSEADTQAKIDRPVILFRLKALQTGSTQVKIY